MEETKGLAQAGGLTRISETVPSIRNTATRGYYADKEQQAEQEVLVTSGTQHRSASGGRGYRQHERSIQRVYQWPGQWHGAQAELIERCEECEGSVRNH